MKSTFVFVVFGVLMSSTAFAQEMVEDVRSDAVTTMTDKAEEMYSTDGVRMGSFVATPSISADLIFNDNIYAAEDLNGSTGNEEEDFITVVKPAVEVKSDWNNHEVRASASAALGRYADNSDEDYEDYNIAVGGRLDVLRETSVDADAFYKEGHDVRTEPNGANGNANNRSRKPIEFSETGGRMRVSHAAGRVGFIVGAGVTKYDYDDGTAVNGATIDQDRRDRLETTTTARINYEYMPESAVYVEGAWNWRDYDNRGTIGSTANDTRDSNGYVAKVGVNARLGGTARADVYIGHAEQDYDSSNFGDVDDVIYGASLLWNPTRSTSVELTATQEILEAASSSNSSAVVRRDYGGRIEQEVHRGVILGLDAGFRTNDYEGVTGTTGATREDDVIRAGADIYYHINEHYKVGLDYDYTDRDSNISGNDFQRNVVMVKLKAAL